MTEDELIEENKHLKGLLWFAWYEFNTIRARNGAPDGISHEYWEFCTEQFAKAIGPENTTPWATVEALKIYSDNRD